MILEATYGINLNKYFKIMNVKLKGRNLVTRRFGLHSNSGGADSIRGMLISVDFCTQKHTVVTPV